MSRPHLRIVVIEDSWQFRRLLPLLDGWLKDVEFVLHAKPLPELADYFAFDGALLDQNLLAGAVGSDIAQQLHALDDAYPLMLMTVDTDALPGNVSDYMDCVSNKSVGDGTHYQSGELLGTLKQWIRWIARTKGEKRTKEDA